MRRRLWHRQARWTYSRFTSAKLWRWAIYGLAGLLAVAVATIALGLARPPDPSSDLPTLTAARPSGAQGVSVEGYYRDPQAGLTVVEVRKAGERTTQRLVIEDRRGPRPAPQAPPPRR